MLKLTPVLDQLQLCLAGTPEPWEDLIPGPHPRWHPTLLRLEHGNDINLVIPWFRCCGLESDPCLFGANKMTSIKVGLRLELGLGLKLGDLRLSGAREMTSIEVGLRLRLGLVFRLGLVLGGSSREDIITFKSRKEQIILFKG